MKAGRELDVKIGKEIFELSDEAVHCWPTSEAEANEALMNGELHTPFILHSDASHDWWECNRHGCANRVVDGEELPICLASTKLWSSNIAAAWEVVEKMIAEFPAPEYQFGVTWVSLKDGWSAGMGHFQHGGSYSDEWYSVFGETAAHAVCLAALKAKGIDV